MTVSDINLRRTPISEDDLNGAEYFSEGVHQVTIQNAEFVESNGKIYLETTVRGDGGELEKIRLYFTESSTKISINTIRKIIIHSISDEEQRKVFREEFNKIRSLLDLSKFISRLKGCVAWLKIEKSERTYVNRYGEVRHSMDRSLYGFEPRTENREKNIAPQSVQVISQPSTPQPAPDMAGKIIAPSQIPDEEIAKQAEEMIDSGKEVDLSDIPF